MNFAAAVRAVNCLGACKNKADNLCRHSIAA
jgi:hypothetical protein